ncbi:MAG: hypothetical protein JXB49_12270 [Bacteroidales bacterium]|nr:hypothetical protein [Bacteroidales bacterium]
MYKDQKPRSFLSRRMIIIGIVGVLVSGALTFLLADDIDKAEATANDFFQALEEQNFESAKEYTSQAFELDSIFGGENVVYSYKMVGFGGGYDSAVWMDFLVDGLPAQTRNISFKFKKTGDALLIEQIFISYQIDREDKHMVERYMKNITEGNIWAAYEMTRDVSREVQDGIYYKSQQYNGLKAWQLSFAKAAPVVEKYQNTKPRTSEFYYYTPDSTFELLIVAAHKFDDRWIDKVEMKEMK